MSDLGPAVILTDPAALPPSVAVKILAYAYLVGKTDELPPDWDTRQKKCPNPLRTVAPLVSKRWRAMLLSDEAKEVLWRRVSIHECSIPRNFSPSRFAAFWEPRVDHVLELDVDVLFTDSTRLRPLTHAVRDLIEASTNLRALRLTGQLSVGSMLEELSSCLQRRTTLSTVYLASGAPQSWQPEKALKTIKMLPNLSKLEIRFPNDTEDVSPWLLDAVCDLTSLRHLALQWPLRSALPPCGDIPDRFSDLSGLTTLQIKRVPLQCITPSWLVALTSLEHLYWEPFLPVDLAGSLPTTLGSLSALRTLYAEMRPPLRVPSGMTALERLILVGRGVFDCSKPVNWDWLNPLTRLISLRLQGGSMKALPESVRTNSCLTRLGLMCNNLTAEGLPAGPWVRRLQHLHLGGNCLDRLPSSLREATALRTLHLANQRAEADAPQGPRALTQRLQLTGADVAAMLASTSLEIVVMSYDQPRVALGGRRRDFEWLQRVLRQRRGLNNVPVRLTTNELTYQLEPLEVFHIPHLKLDGFG